MGVFERLGVARLYFTGGEPFLRPDFLALLKAGKGRFQMEVVTNATLLTPEVLSVLDETGTTLGISLDGANAKSNDAIRGNGVFELVLDGLQACQSHDVPTQLYVTITRGNHRQLKDLALLAKSYSCDGIHFNDLTLEGRARKHRSELELSATERARVFTTVQETAMELFEERLCRPDTACWVDGTTLYMTSEGEVYACSEVFLRNPSQSIGNIRSPELEKRLESQSYSRAEGASCCFGVWASPHVTFVSTIGENCIFAHPRIENLHQLFVELEQLYESIAADCRECADPDCMGYIWLLQRETDALLERGVKLVQVNDGPTFIHSFPQDSDGNINLTTRYPRCACYCEQTKLCLIHEDRPFVCHLYPLGLETTADGKVVWALHQDCLHVRRLQQENKLAVFEHHARAILRRLTPELLEEILSTYRGVDEIASFPNGENHYTILMEACHVEVQSRPRWRQGQDHQGQDQGADPQDPVASRG